MTSLHRICYGLALLLLPQFVCAQSPTAVPYGVSAMTLGAALTNAPTLDTPVSQWTTSPALDQFYRVGGEDGPLQPTQTRMAYDVQHLYVLFVCTEPNLKHPGHHRVMKLADHLENAHLLDTYFPDRVDLFVKPNLAQPDFMHFSATLSGDHAALVRGSALVKVLNPEGGGTAEKDKTVRPVTAYSVRVNQERSAWRVLFRVPWATLGLSAPPTTVGLLPTRTRWRTSERSSPVALDFDDKPAPDLCIETTLAGVPGIFVGTETLTRLPAGPLRWQRPVRLSYPSLTEKKAIWAMQQGLSEHTTLSTLTNRVHLTQRWLDLLLLEGFNVRKETGSPIEQTMHPYLTRRAVNQALRAGRIEAACDSLDAYLSRLNKASRNWFADGSPGNIRADGWQPFMLQSVRSQQQDVLLSGTVGGRPYQLTMQFPEGGGVRLVGEKPGFFTPQTTVPFQLTGSGDKQRVKANGWTVSLKPGPNWHLVLQKGDQQVLIDKDALRFLPRADGTIGAVQWTNALDPKTVVQGFGERYDAANLNGRTLTLWGMDDYFGLTVGLRNQTYKPVPFFQTRGYSLFFNSSYRLRADMGQTKPGRYSLTLHGPVLDLYLWAEPPALALQHYTDLTGKPIVPPRWAFEPWMGRTARNWDQINRAKPAEAILTVVRQMIALNIPHSAIYAEGRAADDPFLFEGLKGTGIRPLSWANSSAGMGLKQQRTMFPGQPDSLLPLLRHADGRLFKSKHVEYVDFTHPQALAVSRAFWKRRLDLGIAGSMVDFGDEVPEDALFADGRRGDELHNFYAYDYHRIFAQTFAERRGDDYILFARAGSAGSQRWMAQFAGDHRTNFTGLRAALTGALNLGVCGFSIWSSETGGFFGLPDPKVYVRWMEFSTFSPLMRMHGTEPREPWEYGDEALKLYRQYVGVREQLLDYLQRQAGESHRTGLPMIRSMLLSFPDQPALATIDDQYMFGTDLLVAPVMDEGDSRRVTFPAGTWTNLWTRKRVKGGQTLLVDAPPGQIPVYVRQGAPPVLTGKPAR